MNGQFSGRANLNKVPPKQALFTMRFIWFVLLLGQLFFMGVMAFLFSQGWQPPAGVTPELLQQLYIVNAAMLVVVVPVVYFIRAAIFRRKRADGTLSAATYSTGNIIFWAGCEGVSFFGLVIALLHNSFWPTILIVVVAMLAQLATIPRMGYIKAPDETFKIE